jgi:hypothetical protein
VISREAARAIEWDCTQLLFRFFYLFDEFRYDDMAALFAPDGVWNRLGKALRRDDIVPELSKRSITQTVRHVVTNLMVTVKDEASADFVLYLTAYQHDSGKKAETPPTIRSPSLLLVVPGRLVKTGEGWRIAEMSMNREFVFPPQS